MPVVIKFITVVMEVFSLSKPEPSDQINSPFRTYCCVLITVFHTPCWMRAWMISANINLKIYIISLKVKRRDFIIRHLLLLCLFEEDGRGEWKCCEWRRSVGLTQSRHASPSHRLAPKLRVMVIVEDKRRRKTEMKHASLSLLLNNRPESRLSCVREHVWIWRSL